MCSSWTTSRPAGLARLTAGRIARCRGAGRGSLERWFFDRGSVRAAHAPRHGNVEVSISNESYRSVTITAAAVTQPFSKRPAAATARQGRHDRRPPSAPPQRVGTSSATKAERIRFSPGVRLLLSG